MLEVEDRMSPEQFQALTEGKGLTYEERETLKRYLGLPHDEAFVLRDVMWERSAVMAYRKVWDNPTARRQPSQLIG
jgi:hypothetical protein